MAHAVVVQVAIVPDSDLAHRRAILHEFVIPEVKALPGFARGVWLNDGEGTGTCVVVFGTEEQARAGLASLTRPGGPPVTASGVHEVEAEA
jgi:hypothetical protein